MCILYLIIYVYACVYVCMYLTSEIMGLSLDFPFYCILKNLTSHWFDSFKNC